MGQLGWVDTGGALEDLSALGDRTHNIQVGVWKQRAAATATATVCSSKGGADVDNALPDALRRPALASRAPAR